MKKMKPMIKRMWVRALLSGKYKQGKSNLKTEEGKFCCLGVLCDLYAKKHSDTKWKERELSAPTFKGRDNFLPKIVREWAGLKSSDPQCNNTKLSVINDDGKRFVTIARLIKENL